ncbi:MAG: hypothetical protein R3245_11345 [Kiloniellales bacterium]|nr:hypothetical protein [Kiloniellales bacterium]
MESADKFKGLDVGTSRLVLATMAGETPNYKQQLNAFVSFPFTKMADMTLKEEDILHVVEGPQILAFGNRCDEFANMLGGTTRRPMATGLLNPQEPQNLEVTRLLLEHLCGQAQKGEKLCFSVPNSPDSTGSDVVYHEESVAEILRDLGYETSTVNEGQAIVFATLNDSQFTGIGMSFGGGLCNICVSYLGVPVASFCTTRAGDYIDYKTAAAIGETPTTVRLYKESDEFVLDEHRSARLDRALEIYYGNVIKHAVERLEEELATTKRLPKLAEPMPVVVAGGTAEVKGFDKLLRRAIKAADLPIEISMVERAKSGMNTTAKGALLSAMLNM